MKKIRVIIAGPRWYADYDRVWTEAYHLLRQENAEEIEIVSGGCSDSKNGVHTFTRDDGRKVYGADGLGERYAKEHGYPCKTFDADWNKYGITAGAIRNSEMANYATHSLVFWDGKSKGSNDMRKKSKKLIGSVIMLNSPFV